MEILLQEMFHFFFHLICSLKALVSVLSATISYLVLFRRRNILMNAFIALQFFYPIKHGLYANVLPCTL